ncbi:MAG: pyruvate formate lyase family protein [Anaerolineae bacterium]
MNRWRDVLAQVRALRGLKVQTDASASTGMLDMRPVWRARAYRDHEGEPEPIVRAQAFRRVLMEDTLHIYPGDALCGSHWGWFTDELPHDLTPEAYRKLVAEHEARGQRDFWAGWDHTLADYPTLLSVGVGGYLARARESLRIRVSQRPPVGPEERDALCALRALRGMIVALEAFSTYIRRWADAAARRGRPGLARLAERVATEPPNTFREALQLVALTHLAFESEGRYAMALGRLDQYLLPFYRRDLEAGRLTREEALDLICHLWVKLAENGGVQNICIGGLTPEGCDATNELSYLCLEATRLVHSPYTNLSARFHDATPERFYRACFNVIRTGIGFPAIFNDHVLIPGLVEIGIPVEVARDHCMVGCIETMLPGRQQAWSDGRYNMALQLERALHKLRGRPALSYDLLLETFLEEMRVSLAAYCQDVNAHIDRFPPDEFPDPFLSALTRDCIDRARDINDGGALYPRMHGIAIMGLATVSDALAAVRKLVFEEARFTYEALLDALDTDFRGYEPMRQALLHTAPKYGNDNDDVDAITAFLVDWTSRECLKHQTIDGGRFVAAMAANISNIPAGKEVGATPDGRRAFTPLSDAASPYFGRDIHGPTAFLNSVSKPDYHRVLTGSVVNMRFDPAFFQGREGERVFVALMKVFVRNRIQELQFNFTDNEALLEAQKHPELHANLIVRVSGFSEYFVRLSEEVQADVIRRRAHTAT